MSVFQLLWVNATLFHTTYISVDYQTKTMVIQKIPLQICINKCFRTMKEPYQLIITRCIFFILYKMTELEEQKNVVAMNTLTVSD